MPSHDAGGSLAGFLWQVGRALLDLLETNEIGDAVRIEKDDDVTLIAADGATYASQQFKHSLGDGRIGPRSRELWSALRVWCGSAMPAGRHVLLTTSDVTQKLEPLTRITRQPAEIDDLVATLDDIAELKPNKDLAEAYKAWKDTPTQRRRSLIESVTIESAQPRLAALSGQLDAKVRGLGVPAACVQEFRAELAGWFQSEVEARLGTGGCTITKEELLKQLEVLHRRIRPVPLVTVYGDADREDLASETAGGHLYLRQLQLLNADREALITAVLMHYRAELERDRWRNLSLIGNAELGEYDADLRSRWRAARDSARRMQGNAISRGWRVFEDCMGYRGALNGGAMPTHVANGSYHMLADHPRPVPAVGWHPDYETLLDDGEK